MIPCIDIDVPETSIGRIRVIIRLEVQRVDSERVERPNGDVIGQLAPVRIIGVEVDLIGSRVRHLTEIVEVGSRLNHVIDGGRYNDRTECLSRFTEVDGDLRREHLVVRERTAIQRA